MFLPTPSPKKVIEKRIQYLEQKVAFEKANKGQYFLKKGIQIELQNIEGFARFLQSVFLQDIKIAKWIGSLSNFDIRTSLEITRDLISSPHLSINEFLKIFVAKRGALDDSLYGVKPYRVKNAIIKRHYTSYPIKHHPYVQNLYYSVGIVDTTPLLADRILQLLMDRKADRMAEDHFLSLVQVFDYFNAMGIERSIVHKHLQFLLSTGLISSYDPSISDIDIAKKIEITPSGSEHYYWSINDIDYAYSMLEVTPITERGFFEELSLTYSDNRYKLTNTGLFLDYLEREDAKFCSIPNHEAYNGQKILHTRFNWQRKIIERNVRNEVF